MPAQQAPHVHTMPGHTQLCGRCCVCVCACVVALARLSASHRIEFGSTWWMALIYNLPEGRLFFVHYSPHSISPSSFVSSRARVRVCTLHTGHFVHHTDTAYILHKVLPLDTGCADPISAAHVLYRLIWQVPRALAVQTMSRACSRIPSLLSSIVMNTALSVCHIVGSHVYYLDFRSTQEYPALFSVYPCLR
jgi:hypothetical protein